jgi:hypothetical protein
VAATKVYRELVVSPFPSSPEVPKPAQRVSQDTKHAAKTPTEMKSAGSASNRCAVRTFVLLPSWVIMLLEL